MKQEFKVKIEGSGTLKQLRMDMYEIVRELQDLEEKDIIENNKGKYETERPFLMFGVYED